MNYIFHVDVNSAFLSWSALKQLREEPGSVDLRTIPAAVGGDIQSRRGVITAKSIPAARMGVKTGEPVVKALQKCPGLVLVRSDFTTYRKYSHAFIDILHSYSDMVQQVSIDEAYMDVTELAAAHAYPDEDIRRRLTELAGRVKDEIRDTLGFTVNVGISTNKLLAKTASDFTKPDRIHTLFPDEVPAKLWPLPIGDLHGCGRATAERLERIGIHTVGDAAHTELRVLQAALGEKGGAYIYRSANGHGSTAVRVQREEAKSYSNETTTPFDITRDNYEREAPAIVKRLSEKVSGRLKKDGVYGTTISVSVKTSFFQRRSRQTTLGTSTSDAETIRSTAQRLLDELAQGNSGVFSSGLGIRLIGVGCSGLDHGEYRQIGLLEAMQTLEAAREKKEQERIAKERKEKAARLSSMEEKIAQRFGKDVLRKGADSREPGSSPEDRNTDIT